MKKHIYILLVFLSFGYLHAENKPKKHSEVLVNQCELTKELLRVSNSNITVALPPECIILSPVDGETGVGLTPIITWEDGIHGGSVTNYRIKIGTTAGAADILEQDLGLDTILTPSPTLDANTLYFITIIVMAVNGTELPEFLGSCNSSFTTGNPCPPPPTAATPQSFCENDNPTVANLVATSIVASTIQWYTITGTALISTTPLVNGATYYATQTVGGCESGPSNNVIVTITPSTSPIATTPQNFCDSTSAVPSVADLQPSPSGIIQWYDENDVPLNETEPLINGATYYYISLLIPVCGTGISNDIVVNINTVSPPEVVSPLFCDSDNPTVGDLTATGANIQWYDASNTLLTNITPLINGATYHATQTIGGCESAPSIEVVVNIDVFPVVDILLNVSECDEYILPTLTTGDYYTGTGGTGTPLNAGNIITTSQIIYIYAANGSCTDESSFTVTINTVSPPTVPPSQTFCDSDNPIVGDLVSSDGDIQWYDASNTLLTNITPLINGATYHATDTVGGCESASSSDVTITIETTPIVDILTDVSECDEYILPVLTVGDYYTDIGGSGTPLNAGEIIFTSQTIYIFAVNNICTDESSFTVTINTVSPPSVPLSQTFCDSDNPIVGDLVSSDGDIQWYDENNTLLTDITPLTNGATYHATDTVGGCESASSANVTVTIETTPIVDILTDVSECDEYILPVLTVGDYYTDIGGSGTPLNAGEIIFTSQTIYIYAVNNICTDESSFTVTINTVSPPSVPLSQAFCDSDNPIVGDLVSSDGDIQWYDENNTLLTDITPLTNGATYHATDTVGGCESASSANVTVTIETTPIVDILPNISECNNYILPTLTIGSYYTESGGAGTLLNAGGTVTTSQTIYIYATTSSGNCPNESSFTVTINSTNSPTVITAQTFCDSDNPTISDLEITGIIGTVNWYNENDELLSDTTSLTNGASYYATQTVDGCESTPSNNVVVTIITTPIVDVISNASVCDEYILPTLTTGDYFTGTGGTGIPLNAGEIIIINQTIYIYAANGSCTNESNFTVTINSTNSPTVASPQIFCDLENSTVADLQVIEATGVIQWYDENDTPLGQSTVLINEATYYATQTVDDCESTASINVLVNIVPTPIVDILTDVSECDAYILPTLTTGDYYTGSGGTGTLLNAGDSIITTQTIYIYTANGTCIDESSFTVTIPVFETVSQQMFCVDDNSIISDIDTGGVEVQWFETQTSQTPLDQDTPLVSGTTYYAIQTCDELGQDRFPVTVSIDVCDFYIPNAFTPDNDGLNDTYNIPNIDLIYPDYIIYIYDRWGNNVYEGKNGWDGLSLNDRTFGSKKVIQGTYYMLVVLNSSETLKSTLLIEY